MIGAIFSGIAAAAGLTSAATGIGFGVKAQQEAKKQFKKTSEGEKAALGIQRMKTADIAGFGGLTAGQYGRALMQDDAYAMQVQGLVNKIEQQSRFGDAFRKEAFYKLALSDIKQFTQKTAVNIQDMDAEAIVRNAKLSIEASDRLRKSESEIIARENEIKRQELEMEAKIASNIGATIESLAKITGASVKYYDYRKKLDAKKVALNQTVAQSSGIAGALSTPQADKVFGQDDTLPVEPLGLRQSNVPEGVTLQQESFLGRTAEEVGEQRLGEFRSRYRDTETEEGRFGLVEEYFHIWN